MASSASGTELDQPLIGLSTYVETVRLGRATSQQRSSLIAM